jgi:hypothetical protein
MKELNQDKAIGDLKYVKSLLEVSNKSLPLTYILKIIVDILIAIIEKRI